MKNIVFERLEKELAEEGSRYFGEATPEFDLYMDVNVYALRKMTEHIFFNDNVFTSRLIEGLCAYSGLSVFDFINDANKQIDSYKKIKEFEIEYGNRVSLWISTVEKWEDWEKCLEVVEWNVSKISENGSDKPIFEPSGDKRYRTSESRNLWVMNRPWNGKPEEIDREQYYIGIVDEIERKIHRVEGDGRDFVRYNNKLYPVHSRFEFAAIISFVRREVLYFFSNIHRTPDPIQDVIPREFICLEEEAHS
ncbi:hypothetical protein [Marinobacterium weihaiense]|uniref:Uncharacterized protein n=1 Tax=Marinobacterium weihaiense TaxID=2851016 RepID=A0ABS6MES9_9GAMM|nr:hypothetical protein [Marinobacterium weihaiense]MBV0934803.1 hypothetical protein [Marinobacterium weihaiense]